MSEGKPAVRQNEISIFFPNLVPPKTKEEWERKIIERLAKIIDWEGKLIEKTSGYRWMIGTSNDWWLDRGEQENEFIIAYRYGDPAKMEKLRKVIVYILGLAEYNQIDPVKSQNRQLVYLEIKINPSHSLETDYIYRLIRFFNGTNDFACKITESDWLITGECGNDWTISEIKNKNSIFICHRGITEQFGQEIRDALIGLLHLGYEQNAKYPSAL